MPLIITSGDVSDVDGVLGKREEAIHVADVAGGDDEGHFGGFWMLSLNGFEIKKRETRLFFSVLYKW